MDDTQKCSNEDYTEEDDQNAVRQQVAELVIGADNYPIFYGRNSIGRLSACDIFINHTTVSKHHAELDADWSSAFLKDKNSCNGTKINQKPMKRDIYYQVKDGDDIVFGEVNARYLLLRNNKNAIITPDEYKFIQKRLKCNCKCHDPKFNDSLGNNQTQVTKTDSIFLKPSLPLSNSSPRSSRNSQIQINRRSFSNNLSNRNINKSNIHEMETQKPDIHNMETQIDENSRIVYISDMETQIPQHKSKSVAGNKSNVSIYDMETQIPQQSSNSVAGNRSNVSIHEIETQVAHQKTPKATSVSKTNIHLMETQLYEPNESINGNRTLDISDMETQLPQNTNKPDIYSMETQLSEINNSIYDMDTQQSSISERSGIHDLETQIAENDDIPIGKSAKETKRTNVKLQVPGCSNQQDDLDDTIYSPGDLERSYSDLNRSQLIPLQNTEVFNKAIEEIKKNSIKQPGGDAVDSESESEASVPKTSIKVRKIRADRDKQKRNNVISDSDEEDEQDEKNKAKEKEKVKGQINETLQNVKENRKKKQVSNKSGVVSDSDATDFEDDSFDVVMPTQHDQRRTKSPSPDIIDKSSPNKKSKNVLERIENSFLDTSFSGFVPSEVDRIVNSLNDTTESAAAFSKETNTTDHLTDDKDNEDDEATQLIPKDTVKRFQPEDIKNEEKDYDEDATQIIDPSEFPTRSVKNGSESPNLIPSVEARETGADTQPSGFESTDDTQPMNPRDSDKTLPQFSRTSVKAASRKLLIDETVEESSREKDSTQVVDNLYADTQPIRADRPEVREPQPNLNDETQPMAHSFKIRLSAKENLPADTQPIGAEIDEIGETQPLIPGLNDDTQPISPTVASRRIEKRFPPSESTRKGAASVFEQDQNKMIDRDTQPIGAEIDEIGETQPLIPGLNDDTQPISPTVASRRIEKRFPPSESSRKGAASVSEQAQNEMIEQDTQPIESESEVIGETQPTSPIAATRRKGNRFLSSETSRKGATSISKQVQNKMIDQDTQPIETEMEVIGETQPTSPIAATRRRGNRFLPSETSRKVADTISKQVLNKIVSGINNEIQPISPTVTSKKTVSDKKKTSNLPLNDSIMEKMTSMYGEFDTNESAINASSPMHTQQLYETLNPTQDDSPRSSILDRRAYTKDAESSKSIAIAPKPIPSTSKSIKNHKNSPEKSKPVSTSTPIRSEKIPTTSLDHCYSDDDDGEMNFEELTEITGRFVSSPCSVKTSKRKETDESNATKRKVLPIKINLKTIPDLDSPKSKPERKSKIIPSTEKLPAVRKQTLETTSNINKDVTDEPITSTATSRKRTMELKNNNKDATDEPTTSTATSRKRALEPANDNKNISADPVRSKRQKISECEGGEFSSSHCKIIFTGMLIPDIKNYQLSIKSLGGIVVDDVDKAEVLVTRNIQRTFKFLCALARGIFIVSPEWLNECISQRKWLHPSNYILNDPEGEEQYDFILQESLNKARESKLFNGYTFSITSQIKKPSVPEIKCMIQASGGKALLRTPKVLPENSIIISCKEDLTKIKKLKSGENANVPVVRVEFIFSSILQQKIDIDNYLLIPM